MKHWCLLCCGFLAAVTDHAVAGDWAHWRGPEQNGISREKNLPSDWSIDGENLIWTSNIGGRSTPIVLNGRVYLNCRTPDPITGPGKINLGEQVVCWDAESGEVLWQDRFNIFQTDIPAPRAGWAAMVGDEETGNVYVHSVSGIFRCYDPDGKVQWEYSLAEEYGKISGYGGRTQTPIIDEDRVIVSFFAMNWGKEAVPPPKHTYYAFDKKSGKLLWKAAPGGGPLDTNYSCPIVTVIDGIRMLIGGNADGGTYAINARSGETLWGFNMSKRGLNTTPVVDGKYVYISNGEDNIDTIAFGRVQCIDASLRGDITETGSVWRVDDIKAGYTALLVKDGILYVVADTGNLYAFDSLTGKQLWIHNLGTVGKGSPVWADGKIYVMEVNGNVHILKPSREGCESLSHVVVPAINSPPNEIYASPAIANGRVYFCTRDSMICIGLKDAQVESDPIPPMADELPATEEIASLHLVPYEIMTRSGEAVEYEVHGFDKNGRFVKKLEPAIEVPTSLPGLTADGATVTVSADAKEQAGVIVTKHGDLTAEARVRVFPPLPWKWDFEGYTGKQVPPTWVNANLKLQPTEIDGGTSMRKGTIGGGRPSADFWIGPPTMKGYTVQADIKVVEQKRKIASIGVSNQRYNFILKGNTLKLSLQSWAAHLRMAKEIRFKSEPDVWYTMKMTVDVQDDGAHLHGKIWKRDAEEPADWTIETVDPHPSLNGSPGLYVYSLAESYFDNVIVSE